MTKQSNKNTAKPICNAPFTSAYYFGLRGNLGFCCAWEDDDQPYYKVHKDGAPEDFWTSKYAQDIRQQMLDGEWPKGCSGCKWHVERGLQSDIDMFKTIPVDEKDFDVVYGNTTHKKPVYLDYRPDNLCNLSCIQCSPGNSTLIEDFGDNETWGIGKDTWAGSLKYIKENKDRYHEIEKFVNENLLHQGLLQIKLLGGEPTINAGVQRTLKHLIDKGYAKDIRLKVTTNFTNLNKTYEMFSHFKEVSITASIDGAGKTYEYVRHPAKWRVVKKNLLTFMEKYLTRPGYSLSINTCIMTHMAFTLTDWLSELLDIWFCERIRIVGEKGKDNLWGDVMIIPVVELHSTINAIPSKFIDEILYELETLKKTLNRRNKKFVDEMTKAGLKAEDWNYPGSPEYSIDKLIKVFQDHKYNEQAHYAWAVMATAQHNFKNCDITKLDPRFLEMFDMLDEETVFTKNKFHFPASYKSWKENKDKDPNFKFFPSNK
jgi:organic radical activating enzyme